MKLPNTKKLREFEDQLARQEKLSITRKFEIADQLLAFAQQLGAIPGKDPLLGLEHDIKRTKLLNGLSTSTRQIS